MKFKIITLGCKVNTYESEYIKEQLLNKGFLNTDENPDIIIINTCSVTNNADNKSLKTVRKYLRENPNCITIVCGCSSDNNRTKYQNMDIDILLGNKEKSKIPDLLEAYIEDHQKYTYFPETRELPFEDMTVEKFTSHTRAFIKIQDGCNNFCSYCIIPYVRGTIRFKSFAKIIAEAQELVKNHHYEIVLTGIHTGSYHDGDHDLSDVITKLAEIPELKRIRLSSIEITELDDKFLNVLKTTPKLCNHLHIPLQSGTDKILAKMNRKYDTTYFQNKIATIRSIRPDISLTTDAIVGHPYETDEDFKEYLKFCESLKFSKIHVFPYSKRDGTASSRMPDVDGKVKKMRAHMLLDLSTKLEEAYAKEFLNQEVEVLTEEYEDGYVVGHTSNYLKIYLKGDYLLNSFYRCKITSLKDNQIFGEVIACTN